MSSLPSHKHNTTLLALLIGGVVLLGVLAILQNQEIKRLSSDETEVVEQQNVAQEPAAGSGDIVAKKTVQGAGFLFDVIHYCDGTVMTNMADGVEPAQFCVGENTLVFKDGLREKIIIAETINSAVRAPVLTDVALVPTESGLKRLLISYGPDACRTTDDCGAGMPENWVSYVFNVADLTARPLANYPLSGDGVWNSNGTKALFVLNACGGAGCSVMQLVGYDLESDTQKPVTTEKAAFRQFEQVPQDIDESLLPYWDGAKWTSNTEFSATIVNTNKTKKVIKGTF